MGTFPFRPASPDEKGPEKPGLCNETKKGLWDEEIKLPYLILFLARAINGLVITVSSIIMEEKSSLG